ncbi:MAG: AraC family transcriptional regulator ligand-binding domain-containing protein [Aquabacterium sp.]|nr:AraC family transcriptional regulator ligand-binding domain-containing protein [Aquabacterium sp.]
MVSSDRILKSLTFPIQYLEIGEALARELHQDVEELYRYCDIDLPRPFMPWQTINGLQMKRALAHFLHHCPPGAPPLVTFMAHFPLTTHGPVGMLAITSATLDEALQGALKYASLVMPAYEMRRQDVGDEAHVIIERKYDFGDLNAFFTETVVLAPLKIMPFLTRPVAGATVYLMHSPLGDPAEYEAAFGVKFVFNARQNKFVLPRQELSIPLIAPSRASHLLMKATLEQQSQARQDTKPTSREVKRRLQAAVRQKQVLDADALSEALAVSPRTLSRRLKDEGTTLPQLRTEVGIEYAEVLLLETDKSIAQIAHAAGFADAAAFTRAFKRATGKTPSQLRSSANGLTDAPVEVATSNGSHT